MKYAEERGGMATSVHDWKPCPPDRFAKLMHQYTTQYGDEYGHGALTMTAMKLDRVSTCTIFYYPQDGIVERKTRSPVLMTVSMIDGKIITFESLKYGVNAPEDGFRDEHGNKVSPDGVKIVESGITITGGQATFSGTLTTKGNRSAKLSSTSQVASYPDSQTLPTTMIIPTSSEVTENLDGTINIKIKWGVVHTGSQKADACVVYIRKDNGNDGPTEMDGIMAVDLPENGEEAHYTFEKLHRNGVYSVGVSAGRLHIGPIHSPSVSPKWRVLTALDRAKG